MKIITLRAQDEAGTIQASNVFVLLYQSVFMNETATVSDKQTTRKIVKLMDALDGVAEQLPGTGDVRLRTEGADLVFEDTEFTQLVSMWESFRTTLKAGLARHVAATDAALDGAKTMTADEWLKHQTIDKSE